MKKNKLWLIAFVVVLLSNLACIDIFLSGPGADHSEEDYAYSDTEAAIVENTMEARDKTLEVLIQTELAPTPEMNEQQGFVHNTSDTDVETKNAGTHRYEISAENFTATCSIGEPITTRSIEFSDNQVKVSNPTSEEMKVYLKTGENEYTYTFMAIEKHQSTIDGETTTEEVEYEAKNVITFSSTGFTSTFYGNRSESDSPSCYHTFTLAD